MKSQQLQAAFARRREQEHMRVERTTALNRYYDHWGKVTSRFENWTAPEYYKQADEQLQKTKDKKDKEIRLTARQEKLKELLLREKEAWDKEKLQKSRSNLKCATTSTETLEKVKQNVLERENIRRKLELEAKLYGKWRHGVDDPNVIFESKTDHEVLAKLNWLDKQVEFQMHKEKDEKLAQERNLRMQEEIRRTVQAQKERQQIREQEIKEIRCLQESHLKQLKQRQHDTEVYKQHEQIYKSKLEDLGKEIELLEESSALILEPSELSQAYNLNKIKVYIRKRSEVFRNQIKLCLDILERVQSSCSKKGQLDTFIQKYKDQLEAETMTLTQIDAMYESEAKYNLKRCEDAWQSQHIVRYNEMKKLLKSQQNVLSTHLQDNQEQQEELLELRSTHLSAIENSNEKLKQLIKEQEDTDTNSTLADHEEVEDDNPMKISDSDNSMGAPLTYKDSIALSQTTNSFSNLNIEKGGIDSPRSSSQCSLQVVTPENVERPKFARKRVAWN